MARIPGLEVLTQRADYLRAARGRRAAMPAFILQAWDRKDDAPTRVGFTCSKKVGNAVARNRAKRRLREIARLVLAQTGKPGYDYVLIGRANVTANRDFETLQQDLHTAIAQVTR